MRDKEPYEHLFETLNVDVQSMHVQPSQVTKTGEETEYQFCFEESMGRYVRLSAIWNHYRQRFYFDMRGQSSLDQAPLLNRDQFVRELKRLLERPEFSLES
jgi:hypothetical protein